MEKLRVFKFGGASVRSAEAVQNLLQVLRHEPQGPLVVVVSAMGKTTNALERLLAAHMAGQHPEEELQALRSYHYGIAQMLFDGQPDHLVFVALERLFGQIDDMLAQPPAGPYDHRYDQLVPYGELLSTTIVSHYLNAQGLPNVWVDARTCLRSDTSYRDAIIDFETSKYLCQREFDFNRSKIFVTQGFIAGTAEGQSTTLGREGSDYTAAILANLLDASSVTIWKDVEGMLNADPKLFANTQRLPYISYPEAIELAYCGAQIIHPKTIKPLQNKRIPLYVRSFLNLQAEGTVIEAEGRTANLPPVYVLKRNQMLISLIPRDFSFVIEDSLSRIFALLYKHRVKVNLVQSSAISFTVVVDDEPHRLPAALAELRQGFEVRHNSPLQMLTIRHYTPQAVAEQVDGHTVYLQQRTRTNARFVMDQPQAE